MNDDNPYRPPAPERRDAPAARARGPHAHPSGPWVVAFEAQPWPERCMVCNRSTELLPEPVWLRVVYTPWWAWAVLLIPVAWMFRPSGNDTPWVWLAIALSILSGVACLRTRIGPRMCVEHGQFLGGFVRKNLVLFALRSAAWFLFVWTARAEWLFLALLGTRLAVYRAPHGLHARRAWRTGAVVIQGVGDAFRVNLPVLDWDAPEEPEPGTESEVERAATEALASTSSLDHWVPDD